MLHDNKRDSIPRKSINNKYVHTKHKVAKQVKQKHLEVKGEMEKPTITARDNSFNNDSVVRQKTVKDREKPKIQLTYILQFTFIKQSTQQQQNTNSFKYS